ncbi:MAG TPA: transposase [Thiopseudomonas sp.]|nr:transposase [Thiopseudomonas sp.]
MQGDAKAIFLGMTPLEDHLRQASIVVPFVVADILDAQDWTPFEERYASTGRAPYAPRAMMGLILYGIMQGISSLRALERLARVDLGCMWVTGGIAPDHANIGRFICLHEQIMAQDFFETLTRTILTRTATSTARLAGDGTVIEAACSHYRLLKEDAVRARVSEAQARLQQASPEQQSETQWQLDKALDCEQHFDARVAARRRSSKRLDTVRVSPTA